MGNFVRNVNIIFKNSILPTLLTSIGILVFLFFRLRLLEINGLSDDVPLIFSSMAAFNNLDFYMPIIMPFFFTALNFYLFSSAFLCLPKNWRKSFSYFFLIIAFNSHFLWVVLTLKNKGIILPIVENWPMIITFLFVVVVNAAFLSYYIHYFKLKIIRNEKLLEQKNNKIEYLSKITYRKIFPIIEENFGELTASTSQPLLTEKLNKYIDANIGNVELNSAVLANKLFMSEKTLRRKLFELNGLTPAVYLRNRRLDYAFMLKQQNKDLTWQQLSYAVGFKSCGYFTQLYKKQFKSEN